MKTNIYIFICFDETTDLVGIVDEVILVAKLIKESCNRPYMLLCEEMLEVNNKTVSYVSFI